MALSAAAASLIAAGIGAAGSVTSAGVAGARNMKIAKYSADVQRQQIQEQNAYNSPLQQMARYKEAGLNPNLMFGDISSGQQSEIAKYETPTLPTPDLGPILQGIVSQAMDLKLKQQQLKNLKQEEFNKGYEGWKLQEEAEAMQRENVIRGLLTGVNYSSGETLTEGQLSKIMSSPYMRKYSAEVEGVDLVNALNRARTDLANFNAKHQEAIIGKILPLQEKLLSLKSQGQDYENELLRIERDLNKHLEEVGGQGGVRLIMDFLRTLLR